MIFCRVFIIIALCRSSSCFISMFLSYLSMVCMTELHNLPTYVYMSATMRQDMPFSVQLTWPSERLVNKACMKPFHLQISPCSMGPTGGPINLNGTLFKGPYIENFPIIRVSTFRP